MQCEQRLPQQQAPQCVVRRLHQMACFQMMKLMALLGRHSRATMHMTRHQATLCRCRPTHHRRRRCHPYDPSESSTTSPLTSLSGCEGEAKQGSRANGEEWQGKHSRQHFLQFLNLVDLICDFIDVIHGVCASCGACRRRFDGGNRISGGNLLPRVAPTAVARDGFAVSTCRGLHSNLTSQAVGYGHRAGQPIRPTGRRLQVKLGQHTHNG